MLTDDAIAIDKTASSEKRPGELAPQVGWVAIAGRPVSIETVLASQETRARWLAPHRGRPDAIRCLCSPARIPLGVKFYEPYGTYALYPLHRDDPGRHAPGCPFGYPPGSRADGRTEGLEEPCVVAHDDGYEVHPDWPLRSRAPQNRASSPSAQSDQDRSDTQTRAARATLLSLLELLWRIAGLHYWRPTFEGKREYATVVARLGAAAERIRLRDQPLVEWFYCPPPFSPNQTAALARPRDAWLARLAPAADGSFVYGYLLGLWRSSARTPDRQHVTLHLRHTPMPITVSAADWIQQVQRWGLRIGITPALTTRAASELPIDPPSWPVVWLARVQWDGYWLIAHDLAALALTDTHSWLPCDSVPERQLLQRLVAERRTFVKPLEAGGLALRDDAVIPDVVLLDRRDRPVLEVLDRMDDPAAAVHGRKPAAWDRARRRPVWTWDPTREPTIPPLPPPDPSTGIRASEAAPPPAPTAAASNAADPTPAIPDAGIPE